jgi:5-methylcytosine-specific restriction enzyme subunit McrC
MDSSHDVIVKEVAEYGFIDIPSDLWVGESHKAIFNSEIDNRDILRPSFVKGALRLQATSYVGIIPINDRVVVRVRPRVPLANLTRMVVATGHGLTALTALREYSGKGTADDWAMDLYASALIDYVDELIWNGLFRVYVRHEDEGHFPHGRMEMSRTLQRFAARGVPNKAVYSWHERTIDNAVNRCVKGAMEAVYSYLAEGTGSKNRTRLARIAGQLPAFDEVSDDPDMRYLDDPEVIGASALPESRAYYRPVLDLSRLIVRGVGIALDLGGRDVEMGSLLIDTNALFENFVRVSLAKHAAAAHWPMSVLDGNGDGKVDLYDVPDVLPSPLGEHMPALASHDRGKAQPDIVFSALDGNVSLVAEVKNTDKGKNSRLPDRGEVEQAVTYALRYGLDFTVLIHPWLKGDKGLVYVGRIRTIDVYDYRLDLSTDDGIDPALTDMATALGSLAGIAAP